MKQKNNSKISKINFQESKKIHFPGFSCQEALVGKLEVFAPFSCDPEDWYKNFLNDVLEATENHKYLPVLRSSHGEFLLYFGRLSFEGSSLLNPKRVLSLLKGFIKYKTWYFSGVSGRYMEVYRLAELRNLKKKFEDCAAQVSRNGWHCVYLSPYDSINRMQLQKYAEWLEGLASIGARIGHLYFVYSLLCGPHSADLMRGKNLLVVTSNTKSRFHRILLELRRLGASHVEFIEVSASNSMVNGISIYPSANPDIVLVGAGVGSALVIKQLSFLNCPVIDAGFYLDLLENPSRKGERIFTVNDSEWNALSDKSKLKSIEKFRKYNQNLSF